MTNPAGYTGAHAARFGTQNTPAGGAGAKPSPSTQAKPAAQQQKPGVTGENSGRDKCKPVAGTSVYDRLTNPAGYTGAHAARFDSSGRGIGGDRVALGGADPRGLQNQLRK